MKAQNFGGKWLKRVVIDSRCVAGGVTTQSCRDAPDFPGWCIAFHPSLSAAPIQEYIARKVRQSSGGRHRQSPQSPGSLKERQAMLTQIFPDLVGNRGCIQACARCFDACPPAFQAYMQTVVPMAGTANRQVLPLPLSKQPER